jgi:hypothetical protein
MPKSMGFVGKSLGDVFFLIFDDIFNKFHLIWLYPTLVRLVALNTTYQGIREETRLSL